MEGSIKLEQEIENVALKMLFYKKQSFGSIKILLKKKSIPVTNENLGNPFVPNTSFLYPLKTSENLLVFWCLLGVEKGCIGNEWVKPCVNRLSGEPTKWSNALKQFVDKSPETWGLQLY